MYAFYIIETGASVYLCEMVGQILHTFRPQLLKALPSVLNVMVVCRNASPGIQNIFDVLYY